MCEWAQQQIILTHWSLIKMTTILQIICWDAFRDQMVFLWIQTWLKLVSKVLIHNKAALFQVVVWPRTGEGPLFELMMTKFYVIHVIYISNSVELQRTVWTIMGFGRNQYWVPIASVYRLSSANTYWMGPLLRKYTEVLCLVISWLT